jgi:hypothetical protein
MPITIDGTNGITQAGEFNSDSSFGFKNRIINGAMVIDQRNAGASATITGTAYTLDRYLVYSSQSSKYSIQQNAGSVTPPTGFTNYLGATSLSAYSVTSSDFFFISQRIEGYNVADLAWGTANAKTVTISFWVRSSLTGTFGGSIRNSATNRSYPFTYTISAANTWEQKSVTIAGDTSGTWITNNGIGLDLIFSLGMGSTFSTTAGAWAAGNFASATGATSVVGTNGATFYITGVQLEVGSTATSFDYRPYTTELQLCQRYYFLLASGTDKQVSMATYYNSTYLTTATILPVTMRTTPSLVQTSGTNYYGVYTNGTLDTFSSFAAIADGSNQSVGLNADTNISGTSGAGGRVRTNDASAYLAFSAEL